MYSETRPAKPDRMHCKNYNTHRRRRELPAPTHSDVIDFDDPPWSHHDFDGLPWLPYDADAVQFRVGKDRTTVLCQGVERKKLGYAEHFLGMFRRKLSWTFCWSVVELSAHWTFCLVHAQLALSFLFLDHLFWNLHDLETQAFKAFALISVQILFTSPSTAEMREDSLLS